MENTVIQQKLRELEVLAHTANVPMDEVLALVERQFVTAAIQREHGNTRRVATDLRKHPSTVYRAMGRLRLKRA